MTNRPLSPEEFKEAQARLGKTNRQMADLLGVTHTNITRRRSGFVPVQASDVRIITLSIEREQIAKAARTRNIKKILEILNNG